MNEALELAVGNRVSLESAQSKPPAGKASAISKSAPSDGRYRRAISGDSDLMIEIGICLESRSHAPGI